MEETVINQPEAISPVQATRSIGCAFWITWLFATVIGSGIGWLAGWWVSFQVPGELGTLSLSLVMGTVLGLAQWLMLRGIIRSAVWWIPGSALGWGIGFLSGAYLANLLQLADVGMYLVLGGVIGLCSGFAQWLVLRRVSSYANWWIPVSMFSWASAFIYYQGGISLHGAFFGLLVGIVSGWALVGIMNFTDRRQQIN
jgi:hypothetical protein